MNYYKFWWPCQFPRKKPSTISGAAAAAAKPKAPPPVPKKYQSTKAPPSISEPSLLRVPKWPVGEDGIELRPIPRNAYHHKPTYHKPVGPIRKSETPSAATTTTAWLQPVSESRPSRSASSPAQRHSSEFVVDPRAAAAAAKCHMAHPIVNEPSFACIEVCSRRYRAFISQIPWIFLNIFDCVEPAQGCTGSEPVACPADRLNPKQHE